MFPPTLLGYQRYTLYEFIKGTKDACDQVETSVFGQTAIDSVL